MLRLLHQFGAGHDGVDPRPGEDRGDALQVRFGHRLQPVGIRSSQELLAGGGTASGPVSFMKGFDAFAGVIKSGGKTRRAAKMVILNADHPDIEEFINCKVEEEKKAWALIDAGYDGSFTGPAYSSVFFQNSNNSVRVTDEFMRAVLDDGEWTTKAVRDGAPMQTYKARDLMRQIAEATHICGDPGMQFDTTVNDWHTCPNTARINASNPCSEYMFLDDSACNLSSINLMKFVREDGEIRRRSAFEAACRTMITAQEILVDNSSYPTPAIEKNSHEYPSARAWLRQPRRAADVARPALRQRRRAATTPAAITALMHGAAFAQSARIARDHGGPFAGYEKNKRAVHAGDAEASRRAQGHRQAPTCRRTSSRRPRPCGTRSSSSASSTASATRRRPCSRRPAPSAS